MKYARRLRMNAFEGLMESIPGGPGNFARDGTRAASVRFPSSNCPVVGSSRSDPRPSG